jgi:hypothetical protein
MRCRRWRFTKELKMNRTMQTLIAAAALAFAANAGAQGIAQFNVGDDIAQHADALRCIDARAPGLQFCTTTMDLGELRDARVTAQVMGGKVISVSAAVDYADGSLLLSAAKAKFGKPTKETPALGAIWTSPEVAFVPLVSSTGKAVLMVGSPYQPKAAI